MGLTQTPPRSRLFFERLIEGALKCCQFWIFFFQRSLGPGLGSLDGVFRSGVPVDPTRHLAVEVDAFDIDRLDPFKDFLLTALPFTHSHFSVCSIVSSFARPISRSRIFSISNKYLS